jgi:hypothetical protein
MQTAMSFRETVIQLWQLEGDTHAFTFHVERYVLDG